MIFPFQEYIEKAREDKIVFSQQMEKYLSKSKSPMEDLHTEETEAEESEEDEDEEEDEEEDDWRLSFWKNIGYH